MEAVEAATPVPEKPGGRRPPRLGFVGSHLSRHPGWVTHQSEILLERFRRAGYEVRATSSHLSPFLRLAGTILSLWRWRRRVDLVLIDVYSGRGFLLAEAASAVVRRLRLPQIQVLHGGALPELIERSPARVRRVLGRAQAVVTPSSYLAAAVAPLGIATRPIPQTLVLEQYSYRHRGRIEPRLLWLRTFHPIYNPGLAVEVLRASGSDATLTMAGQDKGLLASIRAQAADLGGRVRFPGFLDVEAKRGELDAHDIYLHTNRIDNTPVTVLEAAASGLPVIATRVGGLPHLLRHGETALLVEDGDAAGMASAVSRLLVEPELTSRLSAAGRDLAQRSAWPRVRRRWEELFSEILDP